MVGIVVDIHMDRHIEDTLPLAAASADSPFLLVEAAAYSLLVAVAD
jgi:hypothetical protein